MLHLNHFYKNPYIFHDLKNAHNKEILDEMNLLFYGYDITLCKYYVNRLLGKKDQPIKLTEHTTNVLGVDIVYFTSPDFIELNLKTHLSKERSSLVEFIKTLTSTRKASNQKHIIILNNIDALNFQLQYKLRRTLEKASTNASFIGISHTLSKMIEPLQSRFSLVRTPLLTNNEKKHICTNIKTYMKSDKDTTDLLKYLKNIELFQDIVSINISFFLVEDDAKNFTKICKSFKFIDNEVKALFTNFTKNKNIQDSIQEIRQFIYTLIHYNIDHKIIVQSIITCTSKMKAYTNYMFQIIHILKEFDMSIISINQCKIVHAYEFCLLDILTLIKST